MKLWFFDTGPAGPAGKHKIVICTNQGSVAPAVNPYFMMHLSDKTDIFEEAFLIQQTLDEVTNESLPERQQSFHAQNGFFFLLLIQAFFDELKGVTGVLHEQYQLLKQQGKLSETVVGLLKKRSKLVTKLLEEPCVVQIPMPTEHSKNGHN